MTVSLEISYGKFIKHYSSVNYDLNVYWQNFYTPKCIINRSKNSEGVEIIHGVMIPLKFVQLPKKTITLFESFLLVNKGT